MFRILYFLASRRIRILYYLYVHIANGNSCLQIKMMSFFLDEYGFNTPKYRLISTVLWFLNKLLPLKTYINVPTVRNMQKKISQNYFAVLKGTERAESGIRILSELQICRSGSVSVPKSSGSGTPPHNNDEWPPPSPCVCWRPYWGGAASKWRLAAPHV